MPAGVWSRPNRLRTRGIFRVKCMRAKEKIGTLRGVNQWKKLETAGDVKRFMAWCIHSIRDQTIDPKTAAIMAQIGAFMLKAVEVADFEERLRKLEERATAIAAEGRYTR